mgnify:CR=1 FL=1
MDKVDLKEYIGFGTAPADYQIARIFEILEAQQARIEDLEAVNAAQLEELERFKSAEGGEEEGRARSRAKSTQRQAASIDISNLWRRYSGEGGNTFCEILQNTLARPIISGPATTEPGDVTAARLKKLDSLLYNQYIRGAHALSFSQIGKMLDLGKNRRQQMTKLRETLETMPTKYHVEKGRGNSRRVRLTQDYRRHLEIEADKKYSQV